MMKVFYFLVLLFIIGCSKSEVKKPIYNKYGKEIKDCSIRDAKGRGPYEPIGRVTESECFKKISKLCNKIKYKQVHRSRGHFARGKFGDRIKIGICD